MDRVKIIDWLDYKVSPTISQDDEWVVGDSGVNKVLVNLDPVFNDFTLDLLVSRFNKTEAVIYIGVIKNGQCSFNLDPKVIENGLWEMNFRISKDDKVICSCNVGYKVNCGKRFTEIEVPSIQQDEINKLIADLKKAMLDASVSKDDLELSIANATTSKNYLDMTITSADASKSDLENVINSVPGKITDINNAGTTQINAVDKAGNDKIEEIKTTQGMKGDKGDKGDTGATGPQGIQGPIGLTGATGSRGEIGPQGEQGIQGVKGDKGDIGLTPTDSTNIKDNSKFETFIGTKSEWDGFLDKVDGNNYLLHLIGDAGTITTNYEKYISPFAREQPNKHISLCFYGDSTGVKEWNRSSDLMPIKTMNNNGLQVLEEVPGEYKIYIDKDAVMTTVAKYAPGSYQTFVERKADVDNSRSLLKGYKIEWTQKEDSDLFIQCNNEAISKIENQPMTLDEPTQPVVLEPKTVPTTYECCFRVDKKEKNFYIGEGYENLKLTTSEHGLTMENNELNVYKLKCTSVSALPSWQQLCLKYGSLINGEKYHFSFRILESSNDKSTQVIRSYHNASVENNTAIPVASKNVWFSAVFQKKESENEGNLFGIGLTNGVEENVLGFTQTVESFVTKTSTPKPFVKSVMPSGKLAFVTSATDTTHTFLNKGDGVITFGNGYFSLKGEKIQQLLVYNALLTEQEKQAELAKDIKLR